jgi:ribosomal protein S27AE
MSTEASPMICPRCGAEMNHHAEKLLHPTGSAEEACMDPVLGGIVEELHTCPACGTGASRRASRTVLRQGFRT